MQWDVRCKDERGMHGRVCGWWLLEVRVQNHNNYFYRKPFSVCSLKKPTKDYGLRYRCVRHAPHTRLEVPRTPPCYQQIVYAIPNLYHGSIGIPHDPYILPYRHTPRPSRQTDMHTLAPYQCRTNYFKCSFFTQTIIAWNALPKMVVTSSTLDAFKAALPLGRPIPS